MASFRWDPLHDLIARHERLNRLGSADAPGWTPAVDLYETRDRFVASAELPGLSRDDISIEIQPHVLTIRGSRPHTEPPNTRVHRVERGHGAFARSFALPADVVVAEVAAEFRDGVLTITIPKAGSSRRRVDVQ